MFGSTNKALKYTQQELDSAVARATVRGEDEANYWKGRFKELSNGLQEYEFHFSDGLIYRHLGSYLDIYDGIAVLKIEGDYGRVVFAAPIGALRSVSMANPAAAELSA